MTSPRFLPVTTMLALIACVLVQWNQERDGLDSGANATIPDAANAVIAAPIRSGADVVAVHRWTLDDPTVLRWRAVNIDTDAFRRAIVSTAAGGDAEEIQLQLFDDVTVPVTVVRGEVRDDGSMSLAGRIDGDPHSQVIFADRRGFVHGFVSSHAGVFVIEPCGSDGTHLTLEKQLGERSPCEETDLSARAGRTLAPDCVVKDPVGSAIARTPVRPRAVDSAVNPTAPASFSVSELFTIDVLVLYTTYAKEYWASNNDDIVLSKIDAAMEQANDVFERSGTRARLRLAGAREISVTEIADVDVVLDAIANASVVKGLREEYAADLILTLIRNEPAGTKDHAAGTLEFTNIENDDLGIKAAANDFFRAWSLAQYDNLLEWYNFVHCVGHALGCRHDRDAGPSSDGAFPYSYGYKFDVAGEEKITVMATGAASKVVPYFSNPDLTYEESGIAMGVPAGQAGESDCRLTINRTAFEVSQYRMPIIPGPATQRLINVSTRGWIGSDNNLMIAGFVLSGSAPQRIVVRAQGPSLASYGLDGVLADPAMTLHHDSELMAFVDDWQENPVEMTSALLDSGYAPADPLEPALLLDLEPGAYTCVLGGVGEFPTGIGIVEVFALDSNAPRVINLSTRGFVEGGDQSMIAGFVIDGVAGETRRVVIRVVGPSLAEYGVEGVMADPLLKLYDGRGDLIYVNEDWTVAGEAALLEFDISELSPGDEVEPAMALELNPGAYTAVVTPSVKSGTASMPGVGLVEVYEILE